VENSTGGKEKSAFVSFEIKDGIRHDPRDPKSWWMAYAAQRPKWIPVMAPMAEHAQYLTGIPARTFYADATVCA
jgi:hypothetical protein